MASEIDARSSLRLARRRGFISRAEGTTTSPATLVTVNGSPASLYGDATFAASGLSLTTAYTATVHDAYGRVSASTVSVNISNNVTFQYDGNGNLTNDGLRNFVYDSAREIADTDSRICLSASCSSTSGQTQPIISWANENELIQVLVSNQWMSQFSYDGKMRRRVRKEFTWQGSWVQTNLVQYFYDGNLPIQERDINNLPTVTYTRGKDLNGNLQGAGGIGGLLARTSQQYAEGPLAGHAFYHSDANGNITVMIDSSQGIVAKYLYDAFGNTLSASGLLANANVYRFSSKEWHPNSGLTYYLYRCYDPNLQRWLNKDPTGELGGINLYAFCDSDPINNFDSDGQWVLADDALFTGIGAVVGLAGRGLGDLASGHLSSSSAYAEAAVAGAAGGEATLYTGPIGGGVAAGFTQNLLTQSEAVLSGQQQDYSFTSAGIQAGIGGLTSAIPVPGISGLNAGQGSFEAVEAQILTKLENGTISGFSIDTGLQIAGNEFYTAIPGIAVEALLDNNEETLPPTPTTPCQ